MTESKNNNDLTLKLNFLANQIVEGFIAGYHKSPFHGYSSEFVEHKLYNEGESTKHIDWKVYARTNKLYTKKYEEDTNLRCQFILDNSSSMYYPANEAFSFTELNKIQFSCLAISSLCKLMERQRDASGLSIFNNSLELNLKQKSSKQQYVYIYEQLQSILSAEQTFGNKTNIENIDKIVSNLNKRSVVILFSDLLENSYNSKLFNILKHLKFNKHQVILFHVFDSKKEFYFDFSDKPKKFIDLETKNTINLFSKQYKNQYTQIMTNYFRDIKKVCAKHKINYYPADINKGFNSIINNFMIQKQYYSY